MMEAGSTEVHFARDWPATYLNGDGDNDGGMWRTGGGSGGG
ncbi:uncharacterized protein G2W53_003588 [Senna tora]|uniref:Uncharacterized protein n=1 Tax=Senna tora TaxID=362788 RepID=A0A835CIJ9_9FABA|nr:uncharacterized protein G2W53_003588 [Senna tora]